MPSALSHLNRRCCRAPCPDFGTGFMKCTSSADTPITDRTHFAFPSGLRIRRVRSGIVPSLFLNRVHQGGERVNKGESRDASGPSGRVNLSQLVHLPPRWRLRPRRKKADGL